MAIALTWQANGISATGRCCRESRGFQQVWRYVSGTDHSEDTWSTNAYTLAASNGEITNRIYGPGQFYQPDAIGDYSLDFVNNALQVHTNDKPFLLYMAFGSAHFPIQAPQDWVNTNVPVYSVGWDAVRNARFTNMLAQGVLDGRNLLSPNEGTAPWGSIPTEAIPDWNTLAADRQADLTRRMAIYAAMVQKMDQNIGRVVERLRAAGQLDNTLIIALSDNGGNFEGSVFGETGGVPNPTPLTGSSLANMGLNGQPIIYLGGGWAHVNNTPFRLFKHFDHEGGIRTPMIVHWPEGLSRTNQWEDQPGHLIDIMSTIVDVTGVSYPTQFNSHVVLPLEGKSLKPLFNSTNEISRTLGFEHEGNRAWISGSWKFVTKNFASFDGSTPTDELELYDLSKDPTELTNVASAEPVLLGQMVTNWNTWAARVGVPSSRFVNPSQLFVPVVPATNANDLFVDTFNRPDTTNIDASASGMWGTRVPPIGANAAYYEGFEGSGLPTSIQILNNTLQMAVGVGMSENGIIHNFVGQDIIDAGGFSVELTVQEINTDSSDSANRYVGFGVGMSQAEAAAGGDVGALTGIIFRGEQGNSNLGVSDFFIELDLNGNIKVWNNGTLLDTVSVGQAYGTLTASFACTGFTTNDSVTVNVFFNGLQVDINTADTNSMSRTFKWDRNNSDYIGLSARASNYTQMDNLAIRKLPLSTGLPINYAMQHGQSGTNAAPNADPDGDGVTNFAEWAFGGDPAAADPFIASLKGVQVTATHDFQFTFQRLINAANYGLRYRYFASQDFSSWTEITPTQVGVSTNEDYPGYEVVTLQLPSSAFVGINKLFLRVLAEVAN
nr:sulfatase-like hydrolase/transferase [Pedosphaera parvula]